MKIVAVNGSPRKNASTAILLEKALEGAASLGAETELIHLYDLDYKGCVSCFACKLKGGKSYGKCAYRDELSPVLKNIETADGLILGSPIYFKSVTGQMRSFMERLMFPYQTYLTGYKSLFERKLPTGFIYTMNVTADRMEQMGYSEVMEPGEGVLARLFGSCEHLIVNNTYQFDDYSKYAVTVFDEREKAKVREKEFPVDCDKAFDLGARLTQQAV